MRALACLVLAGCAWTSHPPPRQIRYFSVERLEPPVSPQRSESTAELRLGRITASANLRYAIAYRASPVELVPYETLRWTELPESYVRRALQRALFDEQPLAQSVSGHAPALTVEVLAFEELTGAHRGARVALRYELSDDTAVIAHGTVSMDRAASGAAIEDIVAAMRSALGAAASELADRVTAALRARARPAAEDRYAPDSARSLQSAPVGRRAPTLQ